MKKFLGLNNSEWRGRSLSFVLVLVLLSLVKLYLLDGGLVLGEPDEHTHALIVQNISKSPYPQVAGKGWYYGLPLYFYFSYLASLIFPLRFLALRVVSLLASVCLTLGIYFFVKTKVSKEAAFFSALVFVLSPLSVFYSRLGLIEMTVVAFIFLFLFSFDRAWETRSRKLAVLSGLFLGAAILTKYTALPFVAIPFIYLFYSTVNLNRGTSLEYLRLDIIPTLTLLVAFLTSFPLAFAIYRHEPFFFRQQLSSVLGGQTGFGFYPSYLPSFVSWLTWPIAVLAAVGIYLAWDKKEWRLRNVLGFFIFTAYFIFTRDELVPRYFLVLLPFVSIFAGVCVNVLIHRYKRYFPLSYPYILITVSAVLILLMMPKSLVAFRATQHYILEDVGQFIKERNTQDGWIFSNYWPPQVGFASGTAKATWLANCAWETGAFGSPPEGMSALDILREEGGFVVLEEVYSARLINPPCRTEAWETVRNNYNPTQTFTDSSPNFPFTSQSLNKIEVYEIK